MVERRPEVEKDDRRQKFLVAVKLKHLVMFLCFVFCVCGGRIIRSYVMCLVREREDVHIIIFLFLLFL